MQRVRLIHWNPTEAEERARQLRLLGYEVEAEPLSGAALRTLRENPPSAVVIDLSRAPSQGRDLGLNLRKYKGTRHVPLVYVEGTPGKVTRIRELLPDAVYTTWGDIGGDLERAMAAPLQDPVVPDSVFAAYAGTPLPKKLGVKTNSVVALVGAPEGFEETLGHLPAGTVVRRETGGQPDVTLWFVKSQDELRAGIEHMVTFAEGGGLWIAWPKKASGAGSDLTQNVVRGIGLAAGLVDFKVAAIDQTWSGLRFTRRRAN
jgi:CheY-like chemotaxis protein